MVGLGNPGGRYTQTYHNLGFMAMDSLDDRWTSKPVPDTADGLRKFSPEAPLEYSGKPQTFVNCSGEAISCWLRGLNLSPEQLLLIYDDLALDVGRLRIRPSGSSGGHRGVQNIIERLGTKIFPRLRIGIGPVPAGLQGKEYVLSELTQTDEEIYSRVLEELPRLISSLAVDGLNKTMSRWNGVDFS